MTHLANRALATVLTISALLTVSSGNALAAQAPAGDVVRNWNRTALQAVRDHKATDAQAARLYAMVNVAMYDAVNGIASKGGSTRREPALVPPTQDAKGDPIAAAAAAAHAVLCGVYPPQLPAACPFDGQLDADLAGRGSGGKGQQGERWGAEVGAQVLAARAKDCSTETESKDCFSSPESQAGSLEPGEFRNSWSGVQFRRLAPFAISDPEEYVSSGPPDLESLDYAAAFAEVKLLGDKNIEDPEKSATFQYWALGSGTDQPPGAWLQVALIVSETLPLDDTARLFALLSMAMADTVAPTYETKFRFHSWRPETAIHDAANDGNPYTDPPYTGADAGWKPRAGGMPDGTSPEHWSGHSSFSAAGAEVLAGFFCNDDISFTLHTDSAPQGESRTYPSFSSAAAEAGRSRVFGGLHFQFSNQAGLAAGRAVATEVLANELLLERGPTHHGACPL